MQFLLSLIPDENDTDPPTVEIQEVRGFHDAQVRELKGEIEDLVSILDLILKFSFGDLQNFSFFSLVERSKKWPSLSHELVIIIFH